MIGNGCSGNLNTFAFYRKFKNLTHKCINVIKTSIFSLLQAEPLYSENCVSLVFAREPPFFHMYITVVSWRLDLMFK